MKQVLQGMIYFNGVLPLGQTLLQAKEHTFLQAKNTTWFRAPEMTIHTCAMYIATRKHNGKVSN